MDTPYYTKVKKITNTSSAQVAIELESGESIYLLPRMFIEDVSIPTMYLRKIAKYVKIEYSLNEVMHNEAPKRSRRFDG